MAKPWAEVANSDGYKSLTPDQQINARVQYFNSVVAPKLPKDKVMNAFSQFNADTIKDVKKIDPTEGMSMTARVMAGIGKGMTDVGRGIGQLVGAESNQDVQQSRELDAPLMGTTAGKVGDVIGNVAAAAPAAFIPGANTVIGGAAIGGALGLAQPATSGKERLANAGTGALLSGGLAGAARSLPALKRALIDPFTSSGRDRMALDVVNRFAHDPNTLANVDAGHIVPGSQPTLAEVTGDPGIAQLHRAAQSASPEIASQSWAQDMTRNQARVNVIKNIAKTPEELDAAIQARAKATAPLYNQVAKSEAQVDTRRTVNMIDRIIKANPKRDAITGALARVKDSLHEPYPEAQRGSDAWSGLRDYMKNSGTVLAKDFDKLSTARRILSQVKDGKVDAQTALQQLKGVTPRTAKAAQAIDEARAILKQPDRVLTDSPQALHSASKNIADMLAQKGPNGLPVNEAIARELTVVKRSLDNSIGRAEPAYKQAQQTFRDMSKPIDQMKVGQTMLDKATSALPKAQGEASLYPEAMAKAVRGDTATVKAATGFKRNKGLESVLSPDQMTAVHSVTKDLARMVQAQSAGKVPGSPTAQYLVGQNIMKQVMGTLGLPKSWAESLISEVLTNRPLNLIGKPLEDKIQQRLGEMLLNPGTYRKAAQAAEQRAQGPLPHTLEWLGNNILPPATVAASPVGLGVLRANSPQQ